MQEQKLMSLSGKQQGKHNGKSEQRMILPRIFPISQNCALCKTPQKTSFDCKPCTSARRVDMGEIENISLIRRSSEDLDPWELHG
jgi:hypothetical protein